jgi:hypothetical protein
MTIGMLSPGYMAPINWFASASQGGRVMGRLLLMYEVRYPPHHTRPNRPNRPHVIGRPR